MKERVILHSDANCFYASCEMVLNPSLRDKAVAVCGSENERHGIVLAKSERAKKCGVKTGMTNREALSLCPDLVIVPPRFEYYQKFSKLLHKIYERYTDFIEPYGLDECWLDVSDSLKSGEEIASEIRQAVKDELGLSVSIGISFNKVFAKLGSDMKKPDAQTLITRENFKELVWPLPVSDLLYCGRHTSEKLMRLGITTIGALARIPEHYLVSKFGKNGHALWVYANGEDDSRVAHMNDYTPPKSIGHGITCIENLENTDEASKVIVALCQDIGYKLRSHKMSCMGVSLSVKDENLCVFSFQTRLEVATQDQAEIARVAISLLKKNYNWKFRLRALSVTAIDLQSEDAPVQSMMFFDYEKQDKLKRLNSTIDEINNVYGKRSIQPATVLDERKMPSHADKSITLPGAMKK